MLQLSGLSEHPCQVWPTLHVLHAGDSRRNFFDEPFRVSAEHRLGRPINSQASLLVDLHQPLELVQRHPVVEVLLAAARVKQRDHIGVLSCMFDEFAFHGPLIQMGILHVD